MPAGWWWGLPACYGQQPEIPQQGHGKHRGVTQSPKRAKRRNRRKP